MRSLSWRRSARTIPARLTATALIGSAATVAALVATDILPVPSWALDGIDVASHQHPGGSAIDWATVSASGQSFAFIKATEGTGYTNPYFSSDSAKAAAAGITPGSYHYAKPDIGDARSQARFYASTLATGVNPSLPPTLDLEETGGLGPTELQNWVRDWIDEITTLTGRDPIIYTYYSFWIGSMGNTTEFSQYPLWLAYYNDTLPDQIPGGWDEATFWQYTGTGSVDGIITDVDLNTYYGSDAELLALAGSARTGTAVGDATSALQPIRDAAVAEAGVTNTIQHGLAQLGLPVLDIPLTTDLLVNLLGLVAGEVDPAVVLSSALGAGFDAITSQAISSAGAEVRDARVTLPVSEITALVTNVISNGADGITLESILRILTAFGAQNYAAQLANITLTATPAQ